MPASLALLFVGNPGDIGSPFLPPLRVAVSRLLVERRKENIKALLSGELVDAIIVDQDHVQGDAVTELKRIAPRTPVILLRCRSERGAIKPPGITAVCCADPGDEELLKAIPIFFGFILGKQVLNFLCGKSLPSA
jgi:hypothetical protein